MSSMDGMFCHSALNLGFSDRW